MYKSRIVKWGLDKKQKESEVVEMYQRKTQRALAGKKTCFYIRGKEVDWKKVEAYVKRKPLLHAKIRTGMLEIGNAQLGIVCRTPSPDPTKLMTVYQPMEASDELSLADDMVRIARDYYDGGIEGGYLWSRGTDGWLCRPGTDRKIETEWWETISEACELIANSEIKLGFETMRRGFDILDSVIRAGEVLLLPSLFDAIYNMSLNRPEIYSILVAQVAQLMQIIFNPRHPLRLIWHKLQNAPTKAVPHAIKIAARCILGHMESTLGHHDPVTSVVRLRYACQLATGYPDDQAEKVALCEREAFIMRSLQNEYSIRPRMLVLLEAIYLEMTNDRKPIGPLNLPRDFIHLQLSFRANVRGHYWHMIGVCFYYRRTEEMRALLQTIFKIVERDYPNILMQVVEEIVEIFTDMKEFESAARWTKIQADLQDKKDKGKKTL
jgi:hypothetical protein